MRLSESWNEEELMKQTTNYGLKMPEVGDALSVVPLNENAQAIDAALYTIASGKVMMACGSYTGTGTASASIETPGFIPQVVLMRTKDTWLEGLSGYYQSMAVRSGWCLWMGEESMTVVPSPSGMGEETRTVDFTVSDGSLSWSTDDTVGGTGPAIIQRAAMVANNDSEQTYQWIALGVAKE